MKVRQRSASASTKTAEPHKPQQLWLPRTRLDQDKHTKAQQQWHSQRRRRVCMIAVLLFVLLVLRNRNRLLSDKSKDVLKQSISRAWVLTEWLHLVQRYNYFSYAPDYYMLYPELQELEGHFAEIQQEAAQLLSTGRSQDQSAVAGSKFSHTYWKVFWMKMGNEWITENEHLAPRTAELVRAIPGVDNALFSELDPDQYIKPHFGVWRGFARYHLALSAPAGKAAVLRVQPESKFWNHKGESHTVSIERSGGIQHEYVTGHGVVWDDTYLHDVRNSSPDETRVILWLDLRRRDLPWFMRLYNNVCLYVANHDAYVKKRREKAKAPPLPDNAEPNETS